MRSLLFVPGHDLRKMEKGLGSAADALILDLEDAVPESQKSVARSTCRSFLETNGASKPIFVRVNEIGSPHLQEDLDAVISQNLYGIMLPKCQGPEDLATIDDLVGPLERRCQLAEGSIRVLPIVTETALGVLRLPSFNEVTSRRLCGMLWGGEDLAADIGASKNRDEQGAYTSLYQLARSLTLLGATASNVIAIDAVYSNFRDSAGLQSELSLAVRDGFAAKAAIHPDQIAIINAAFTPSQEEVDAARRVVEAFEAATSSGVAQVDGKMIVKPYYLAAKRVLSRVTEKGHS